jgi:flagellar protein FlaF
MTYKNMASAATAYAQSQRPASNANAREVEAWALTMAATRLKQAEPKGGSYRDLQEALVLNQRLWRIFQAEAEAPECPLPKQLRDQILALANYVDNQTFERQSDLDFSKVDALVKINLELAAGLRQKIGTPISIQTPVAQPTSPGAIPQNMPRTRIST